MIDHLKKDNWAKLVTSKLVSIKRIIVVQTGQLLETTILLFEFRTSMKEELPKITEDFLGKTPKTKIKKGGPYNRHERIKLQEQIAKFHFEYNYSNQKIAKILGINRKTVYAYLKEQYAQLDYSWTESDVAKIVKIRDNRLKLQQSRLRELLDSVDDVKQKLAIEKHISTIEFKLMGAELKFVDSANFLHKLSNSLINKTLEQENSKSRYLSPLSLRSVAKEKHEKIEQILQE